MTGERKGADHTLAALKSIRASEPAGYRLYVILDNLSADKTPAIRRWAGRAGGELCFTSVSASWANPVEAQFGPVRTFVTGGPDHPDHTVMARGCRTTCAGATPTPAAPMCSPPSAANGPASAANANGAGGGPSPRPHDSGGGSWA